MKRIITINGMNWSERELAQIIRRKMISKAIKNKKKYTRKAKHKMCIARDKDGILDIFL